MSTLLRYYSKAELTFTVFTTLLHFAQQIRYRFSKPSHLVKKTQKQDESFVFSQSKALHKSVTGLLKNKMHLTDVTQKLRQS